MEMRLSTEEIGSLLECNASYLSEPEESENVPENENKLRELNHVLLRNNDRPTPDPVMAESCKTSPQEQDGEIVHQLLDRPINNSMVCIEDCELESDIDTKVQDNNSVFRQLHYNVLTPDLVAPELETNVQEKHDTILCQPLDSNDTDANETYFAGDLSENFNVNSLEVGHEVTLVLNVLPSESTNFSEGIPNNINPVNDNDPPQMEKNYHTNEEEHNGMAVKDDMEVEETEESEDELPQDQKTRSRKRLVNRKNWKSETIKRKRQSGQEYGDRKGKVHRGKMVQGECKGTCKFQCAKKITKDERNQIHKRFWSLSDTGKNHFYSKFVKREVKKRSRTVKENSRRKFSFMYYLGTEKDERIRVCKEYFFKTLDISQRRVYWFFEHVYDVETAIGRSPMKGKSTKSHIDDNKKDEIRNHIKSFPRVEAHYCRKDTEKEYLEGGLTLTEMYRLYKKSVENPLKESLYRFIFNTEFNIEFFKPKKDRCDTCEAYKANPNPSQEETVKFEAHKKEKESIKDTRDKDRTFAKKALDDSNTCIVAFDLENVFALPKAEVSNYFYKRKLNCYNLTAHSTYKGQIQEYCLIWHELISGRAGNHLASAVYKFLNDILYKNNEIKKFILWSDSCVPQNKNSIMTLAIQTFMNENTSVEEVVQRYSEPGHGVVQEVDAIHSKIEKWLKPLEVFSPLSLVRIFVNKTNKDPKSQMKIIQMLKSDFFDFQTPSKLLNYSVVPYTKVKEIVLNRNNLLKIKFRRSITTEELTECSILKETPRKPSKSDQSRQPTMTPTRLPSIPRARQITSDPAISVEKKRDIISMMKYMPQVDREFYEALFKMKSTS